ncbi:unnamed protein product, partial [Anisakis simplex]|uniref:UBX domain-containing protein n=1 Tax=Anisakis simplex TaxID=6269 RepID=A0A0M3JFS1_ANISI
MLEAAAENGFRCSLCRPQGNTMGSDALNVLQCDNVSMNKCALDVLHTKYGGSVFRSTPYQDSFFDMPVHSFISRGHSFDGIPDVYEDDELEFVNVPPVTSGRGRGMRGGGPGRRMQKLGVGGFSV